MTVKHHRVKGNDPNLIHFEKCCTKKKLNTQTHMVTPVGACVQLDEAQLVTNANICMADTTRTGTHKHPPVPPADRARSSESLSNADVSL